MSGGLRKHAARGTIINSGFRVSIAGLSFLQRILVAAFLTPAELGVWGIVLVVVLTLLAIKNTAIGDRFVQQSEPDQAAAFQRAFTFEMLLTGAIVLLTAASLPFFALAYGEWNIILPGLILSLAVVGNSLQAPTWIYYRRMNFARQRALEAIDPCTTFLVTIGLAIMGAGYWSLVLGAVIGSWTGGIAALTACPYRLQPRLDRGTIRDYAGFSWPLVAAQISGIAVAQGSLLAGAHTVGIAGVGAIALAFSIIAFSDGVDAVITQTIYPAICAVRDRTDLLFETFVKSNRLALMWGMPFGLGLALFASDLVHFVIGDKWESAVVVMQAFGVMAAMDQLGFNWTAFLRARNETRPLALVGALTLAAFGAIAVPLLIVDGLRGFALGMVGMAMVALFARAYFLARLFSGFRMLRHAARAAAASVPAVAIVLVMRLIERGDRTLGYAIAELITYLLATAAATLVLERSLLAEVVGYLRRTPGREESGLDRTLASA